MAEPRTRFFAPEDRGGVLCDGIAINHVVGLDTAEGWAVVVSRKPNGSLEEPDGEYIRLHAIFGEMEFFPNG